MRKHFLPCCLSVVLTAVSLPAQGAPTGPVVRDGYRLSELARALQQRDWMREARPALAGCTALPPAPALKPGKLYVTGLVKDRFFNKFFQGGGKLYRLVTLQKGVPMAVVLESGQWSLAQLQAALAAEKGAMVREGNHYLLRLPLLIQGGAGLSLGEGESLRLSRDRGVFLINLGMLYMRKARLEAWDEEHKAPALPNAEDGASFQPFLLGWSGSVSVIRDSTVSGLGFAENLTHGLTFAAGPQGLAGYTLPPPPQAYVIGSRVEAGYSGVHASATPTVRICDSEFAQSRLYAVQLDSGSTALLARNRITGTLGPYALYFTKGVHDTWVVTNTISENQRSGISISDSRNLVLAGNEVRQNFDAIFLQNSEQVLLADNRVLDNQRHGVSLRNVGQLRLQNDHIGPNRGVGILAQPADPQAAGTPQPLRLGTVSLESVPSAPVQVAHVQPGNHRLELLGVTLEGNHSSTLVVEKPYTVVMDRTDVIYPGVRRRPVFRGVLNRFESDILYRLPRQRILQLSPVTESR